ncbi:hypothetical protein DFH09DRAFT_1121249 [Mycena vulgaris]|nr:hypothetical protein DFH09DRAFT_1121249 [Mycena vulgaris]
MARQAIHRKRLGISVLLLVLFAIAPDILRSYPQTAALAVGLDWLWEKCNEGAAALNFVVAVYIWYSVMSDLRAWFTGAPRESIPTPAELEDGTARAHTLHELSVLEAEVAGTEPPTPPTPEVVASATTTTRDIAWAIVSTLLFLYLFFRHDATVLEGPPLEIIGTVAVYILHGLEVLLVALILLGGVRWFTGIGWSAADAFGATTQSEATAAAPVEVLFDEEAVAEDSPPSKTKEEEFVEMEKA